MSEFGWERYVIFRVLRGRHRHKGWGEVRRAQGRQKPLSPHLVVQDVEEICKTYNPQGRPTS